MSAPASSGCWFNVRDYGARGDDSPVETAALQRALDACGAAGGGTVFVPPGVYRTGALRLHCHLTLHLEAGAVLAGSGDRADYPAHGPRLNSGTGLAPLIGGENLVGISLRGGGVIDGRGAPWWREFLAWRDEHERHQRPGDPAREPAAAPARPRLVSFERCRDVRVEGLTLRDAPAWTLHFLGCEFVRVDGLRVLSACGHPTGPSVNTDGINPESCRHVWITRCYVAVGDDNITLKAGSEHHSLGPCENVVISDCVTGHGHGGVVIGSEMSGGVRNVAVTNCVFQRTYRGIRVKSRRGRGGVVENLLVQNVVMEDVPYPFFFDKFYFDLAPAGRPPVGPGTPAFRGFSFSHITATGAEKALHLVGLPEQPIADVRFDRVDIASRRGAFCRDARDIDLGGLALRLGEGEPVHTERVSDLRLPAGWVAQEGRVDDLRGQYQEREVEARLWRERAAPPFP